jgi:acetyl esterase/lipase
MRNVADHTSLADIVLVRRLVSLHVIIPLPADAVVTPITFTVPVRKGAAVARGFLKDLDLAENGTRELSGEWVVGTDVWRRLKAERRARQEGARKARRQASSLPRLGREDSGSVGLTQDGARGSTGSVSERVIYYVHGGAYYVGNAATHRLITIGISKACNARVFGRSPDTEVY